MKKLLILILSLAMFLSLAACGATDKTAVISKPAVSQTSVTTTQKGTGESGMKVRLTAGTMVFTASISNTAIGRDFASRLPLKLTLKDYAETEKIAYLPQKLSIEGAPAGFDPSVGDLTYYAPWGNLAIFYKDYGYAAGLVSLGRIEAGIDKLAQIKGDVEVTIERIE